MKFIKYYPFLLSFFIFVTACSSTRRTEAKKEDAPMLKSKKSFSKAVEKNSFRPKGFTAKAKAKYDDGKRSVSLRVKLKIQTGEAVWANASFLGLEAARVLITRDSFFLINRLEKSYVAEPLSALEKETGFDATLDVLQDLLFGNVVIYPKEKWSFSADNGFYTISQSSGKYALEEIVSPLNLRPASMVINQKDNREKFYAYYEDVSKHEKGYFPYIRTYIIEKDNMKSTTLRLDFSDLKLEEHEQLDISIPGKYERNRLD